jgi:hypothetical protein
MAEREQDQPIQAGSLDGSDEQKKQGILVQALPDVGSRVEAHNLQARDAEGNLHG